MAVTLGGVLSQYVRYFVRGAGAHQCDNPSCRKQKIYDRWVCNNCPEFELARSCNFVPFMYVADESLWAYLAQCDDCYFKWSGGLTASSPANSKVEALLSV